MAMETLALLKETYGLNQPIFLKNIRIGGKSKTAIKQELYRAAKTGLICRSSNGVYYFPAGNEFGDFVSFEQIITKRYIHEDSVIPGLNLQVYGYYSGMTFLHDIGISEQVPAVLEVTSNKATSNKRIIKINNRRAIIRKPKTAINANNYKILQFLDMFYFIDLDTVKENKKLLREYILENFSRNQFLQYACFCSARTLAKISGGGLLDAFR